MVNTKYLLLLNTRENKCKSIPIILIYKSKASCWHVLKFVFITIVISIVPLSDQSLVIWSNNTYSNSCESSLITVLGIWYKELQYVQCMINDDPKKQPYLHYLNSFV